LCFTKKGYELLKRTKEWKKREQQLLIFFFHQPRCGCKFFDRLRMSFEYHSNKTAFKYPLTISKCTAINTRGRVCGKQTSVEPLCPTHLARIFGVAVRPSSIPDAGLGLFTLRDIRKNSIIVPPYTGVTHSADSIRALYQDGSAPCTLQINNDVFVDASYQRSWAAFINHAERKKANARFAIWTARRVANIRATRDIKAGSEIFIDYGNDYFRFNDNVVTRTIYPRKFEVQMNNVNATAAQLVDAQNNRSNNQRDNDKR